MFRLGLISTNFILSQAELNKKCPTYPEGYIGHMIPVVAMQLVRPPTGIYDIQQEPPCIKFVIRRIDDIVVPSIYGVMTTIS